VAGQRCRRDGECSVKRNCLDGEDLGVGATGPSTDRAGEAHVVARIAVILREQLGPAESKRTGLHRRVEVGLEQRTRALRRAIDVPERLDCAES
jgi:hypothetical protein